MNAGRRRALLVAVVAGLVAASAAPLALITEQPLDHPDALVILASHEWERIPAAARLAQDFPAAKVLLTVSRQSSDKSCHLCAERPRWLNHLGVDGDRIVEVLTSIEGGTWAEAVAVTDLAKQRSWGSILVVTSVYHTRRSLWTFRKAAGGHFDVGVASAEGFSQLRPGPLWWAEPEDRYYVAYEWAALFNYAVMGRLAP